MSNRSGGNSAYPYLLQIQEVASKLFVLALIAVIGLYGYMFWGIFSKTLVDVAHKATLGDTLAAIRNIGQWLDISLLLLVVSSFILFYDDEKLGAIYVLVAGLLTYGVNFLIDSMFSTENLKQGQAAELSMQTLQNSALILFVPGILHVLYSMYLRVNDARAAVDLTNLKYGKGIKRHDRPKALIGAFANCWELPFCRDGIRVRCPIFHAKTKCWTQRVGCMCEENIILLAMEGMAQGGEKKKDEGGFVPLGDILAQSTAGKRESVPMRVGPRGVKIPDNPHLTSGQKRERCRNCIIYNEHQRQKYKLLSPIVTLAVPALVFLNWDALKSMVTAGIGVLDHLLGGLALTGDKSAHLDKLKEATHSLPVESVLLICITLVLMTMALRFLEFCMFKIKI